MSRKDRGDAVLEKGYFGYGLRVNNWTFEATLRSGSYYWGTFIAAED
jgi:hypothetical protein